MYNKLYKSIIFLSVGFLSYHSSYAQCPNLNSFVIGDTVCSNSADASVSILNTDVGVSYQAFLGTTAVGDPVISSGQGSKIELVIPVSALSNGNNQVTIRTEKADCTPNVLSNVANIVVNLLPSSSLKVIGDTICSGRESAKIKILGTKQGESYQLFRGNVAITDPIFSNGSDIIISIPESSLNLGISTITVIASIHGCASVILDNPAIVVVNPIPVLPINYEVKGDTICSSNPNAEITITPTSKLTHYQLYKEDAFIDSFYGDSTNYFTVKKIPTSLLTLGENIINVKMSHDAGLCGIVDLPLSTKILVHPAIEAPVLKLTGDTVYISDKFATVKIENSPIGLTYNIKQSQLPDTNIVANSNTLEYKIPIGDANGLLIGTHKIYLNAEIVGCNNVTIRDSIYVLVISDMPTSIQNELNNNSFMVWPNPFHSELHISSKGNGNMKVQILDGLGNKVHQQTISASEELKINPDLKSGLYFLQIENEGKIELMKLIKQ